MITPRDNVNVEETDVVNILINTLKKEGDMIETNPSNVIMKIKNENENEKMRGKGQVSFETTNDDNYMSIGQISRTSLVIPNTPINKDHQTLLDTLAELAGTKSPVRSLKGGDGWGPALREKRPRAMSDPWLVDESYSTSLSIHSDNNDLSLFSSSLSMLVPISDSASSAVSSSGDVYVPASIAAWASRRLIKPASASSSSSRHLDLSQSMLPQILEEDYGTVYNKNGRIGIYTKEERQSIISRFQDKRRTRVWKKKIRYHCRKDLADRRIRIKGRFVRVAEGDNIDTVNGGVDSPIEPLLEGEEEEGDGVTSSEDEKQRGPGPDSYESSPLEPVSHMDIELINSEKLGDKGIVSIPKKSATDISNKIEISGEAKGSATDGMKAFWDAIQVNETLTPTDTSLNVKDSIQQNIVLIENGDLEVDIIGVCDQERPKVEEFDEDENLEDEEGDIWDTNGEMKVGCRTR
eukprot:CAMPEP_0119039836 /NCGR_PEP_ID=MMETSP1177-20130426/9537_1 /TAXON_ID=2985 /ORGANISM="Ochromonas sp, Strain CCMP1899" /LENGTH=464 /DNA_ID=CAMNT_0007004221 /DNA_START=175 /DNA_END=1566 /DNA_ORIENTATION=-